MKRTISMIIIAGLLAALVSCAGTTRRERSTGTGAAIGAGVGAILGQAIGSNTESTILGAGIGAVLGGIAGDQVGAYMDRQEDDLRRAVAASEETARQREATYKSETEAVVVQRTHDVLTATFRSEVLFDFDSSVIKPGGRSELARVAAVLNKYPQTTILVEGHTDQTGSQEYNLELSERRALAVKNALVEDGVNAHRIRVVGYGKSRPISSDDAANRRVTIVIEPVAKG
jgi:outer membrane protein OmpA-like peptidoglycan-associated protein